ncbi:MAG: dihydrolipoyl dehydrogenase [Turicibacter sp.]|nr:dihydrolipoyl dehydrogenase [Turicibacter sp.]
MYDLIVLGGGPGGYVAAIRGAKAGLKTALVSNELGGTCLQRGCIPTKTFLHIAGLHRELDVTVDIEKMYRRKEEIVGKLVAGIETLIKTNKIDYHKGQGVIKEAGKVVIGGELTIEGKNIIIATGSVPSMPPIEGLGRTAGVLTSNELLAYPHKFKRLVIVGGGVIGVEFADIFANLGADVTIVEFQPRLLAMLDKDIGTGLAQNFKQKGITVLTSSSVEEISKTDQLYKIKVNRKDEISELEFDGILIATGRKPTLKGVELPDLALGTDGGILIDSNFRTNLPNIYAIGDCVSENIQLAHFASAQATNCVAVIANQTPPVDLDTIPSCIYCSPEIAVVGLSEDEAKAKNIPIKVSKYVTAGNPKCIIEDAGRGFVKLIADKETSQILGAALVIPHASDMISELALAIKSKQTPHDIATLIHPHPSFTESILEAAEDFYGQAVHVNKR